MGSGGWLTTLIAGLLTVGGGMFLTTVFRGLSTIRSGGAAREREAIDYVGRARAEAELRLRISNQDRDYYQRMCARYAAQLARAGIEPDPVNLVPPSDRRAE